jgi:hypothetical protein
VPEPPNVYYSPRNSQSGYLPIAVLGGNLGAVTSTRFSKDSRNVISGSTDHTARKWGIAPSDSLISDSKLHFQLENQMHMQYIMGDINHFSTRKAPDPRVIHHDGPVNSVEFNGNGKRMLTTSDDKTARLWDGSAKFIMLHGHQGKVTGGRFSADDKKAVTACDDGYLRIWNLQLYKDLVYQKRIRYVPPPLPVDHRSMNEMMAVPLEALRNTPSPAKKQTPAPETPLALPPAWFPDFLTYLGQRRFDSTGALESVPPAEWLAIREKLRAVLRAASPASDDPYLAAMRHWVKME